MIEYYVKQTMLERLKLGIDDNYIVYLKFTNEKESEVFSDLAERVFTQLDEYLSGNRKRFELPLKLEGTDFQQNVWNSILSIPYGETRSYMDIAFLAGNKKAVRVVGAACKNNPVWIIVPCHRVIASDGKMSGYAGGVQMKNKLLLIEKENVL